MKRSSATTLSTAALMCAMALPVSAQDWAGAYGGLGLSFSEFDLSIEGDDFSPSGVGAELLLGYNFQNGNWVFSPELIVGFTSGDDEFSEGSFRATASSGTSATIRGRVGYVADNILPYLAIGYTSTDFDVEGNDGTGRFTYSETASGVSVALGLDYAVNDNAFVRFEVDYVDYDDGTISGRGLTSADYELEAYGLSISYAFRF